MRPRRGQAGLVRGNWDRAWACQYLVQNPKNELDATKMKKNDLDVETGSSWSGSGEGGATVMGCFPDGQSWLKHKANLQSPEAIVV